MTDDKLRELKELAGKADHGPWFINTCMAGESCWCRTISNKLGSDELDDCIIPSGAVDVNNAKYIAAANPQTVLELIAEIERLKKAVQHNAGALQSTIVLVGMDAIPKNQMKNNLDALALAGFTGDGVDGFSPEGCA